MRVLSCCRWPRLSGGAVYCKGTNTWAVFGLHLLFRERMLPLSLVNHIHPLPLLHTIRQLILP